MRPASQRSSSVNGAKPGFQTKLKSRVGSGNEEFNISMNSSRQHNCTLFNSRHNHDECRVKEDIFNQSFGDIYKSNFQHHDPQRCVCESCECGRHLCKLHVVKPNLTKNSIYQRSFNGKKAVENVVNHDKEYDRLNGPHLDMASTYAHELSGRKGDKVVKPHPEDLLKSGGPAQNLTSYSSQFPGYRGGNQYVKPTDKHTRAEFPLRSRSEYSKEFASKAAKKDDYTYIPDQLKTGSNWYGKTTYGDFFADQNPEYHAKKVKVLEKRNPIAGSNHMYGTIWLMQRPPTRTTSSTRKPRFAQLK